MLCPLSLSANNIVHSDGLQSQQRSAEKRTLQIANTIDDAVHIMLCCDENDRFPMYTLINSVCSTSSNHEIQHIQCLTSWTLDIALQIIQNEDSIERLHFHILVLQNVPLFVEEFTFFFSKYLDSISFEFRSIVDDHPQCIEYSNIAATTLPAKQARNWLNNIMNFARFCAPNVFDHVHVGIYLDVDMVVQDSISTLYDAYYHREGRPYSAWSVLNRSPYRGTFRNEEKAQFINDYLNRNLSAVYPSVAATPLDLKETGRLFNAGILMFDFEIWRRHNFTGQSIELFRFNNIYSDHFGKKPWSGVTQPILNMLFVVNQIEVGDFGADWNLVVKDMVSVGKCTEELSRAKKQRLENAKILHWAGGCKPWITAGANTKYLWLRYVPHKAHLSEWEDHFNLTMV